MTDRLRSPLVQDALLALALAVALELQIVLSDSIDASAVTIVGALAITAPIAWRRRAPLAVTLVFAGCSALQAALGGDVYDGAPPPVAALLAGVVVFYTVGAYAAERDARLGLVLGVAGLWSTHLLTDRSDLQGFLFAGGLIGLAPWLAGRVTRARTLRAAALEQAAASEERQRIARELHDVVAHGVVLMVLQAQGARRILDQDPDRAREALEAIEETGKNAVHHMMMELFSFDDVGQGYDIVQGEGRVATTNVVVDANAPANPVRIAASVAGSTEDVASSNSNSAGRLANARANANQCFPVRTVPSWPKRPCSASSQLPGGIGAE